MMEIHPSNKFDALNDLSLVLLRLRKYETPWTPLFNAQNFSRPIIN